MTLPLTIPRWLETAILYLKTALESPCHLSTQLGLATLPEMGVQSPHPRSSRAITNRTLYCFLLRPAPPLAFNYVAKQSFELFLRKLPMRTCSFEPLQGHHSAADRSFKLCIQAPPVLLHLHFSRRKLSFRFMVDARQSGIVLLSSCCVARCRALVVEGGCCFAQCLGIRTGGVENWVPCGATLWRLIEGVQPIIARGGQCGDFQPQFRSHDPSRTDYSPKLKRPRIFQRMSERMLQSKARGGTRRNVPFVCYCQWHFFFEPTNDCSLLIYCHRCWQQKAITESMAARCFLCPAACLL